MSRGLQGLADPPAQHQWHAAGQYPPPPALTRTADPMLALGTAGEVPSPQPHARRLPGQQTARPACARPTARRPHLTRDRHSPAHHPHRELTGNARSSVPPGRPGRARGLRPTQNGTIGAPRAGQYDQPLSVQIGGSARGYQELFAPLAIPTTASRHAARPVYLYSTALGANARSCRILRPAPSLCCRAAAGVLPRRNLEQRPA